MHSKKDHTYSAIIHAGPVTGISKETLYEHCTFIAIMGLTAIELKEKIPKHYACLFITSDRPQSLWGSIKERIQLFFGRRKLKYNLDHTIDISSDGDSVTQSIIIN